MVVNYSQTNELPCQLFGAEIIKCLNFKNAKYQDQDGDVAEEFLKECKSPGGRHVTLKKVEVSTLKLLEGNDVVPDLQNTKKASDDFFEEEVAFPRRVSEDLSIPGCENLEGLHNVLSQPIITTTGRSASPIPIPHTESLDCNAVKQRPAHQPRHEGTKRKMSFEGHTDVFGN